MSHLHASILSLVWVAAQWGMPRSQKPSTQTAKALFVLPEIQV